MSYHPPEMITNNASPALSADLAYEAHGKCGCQTIILSDLHLESEDAVKQWEAVDPSGQPELEGCSDYSNVYKIVALSNVKFRSLEANNIPEIAFSPMLFGTDGFIFKMHSEMLADFTAISILTGTLVLYRDCNQS